MALRTFFKDFIGGLARGLGLFFSERNDYVILATTPGLKTHKRP